MAYAEALAALADPTRREIFERLREGPRAVGEIALEMPVSRPAVSQHLKVLKLAGLVTDRPEGTRRVYCVDPQGLGAIRQWLDQFWAQALAAFGAELDPLAPAPVVTPRVKPDEPHDHRRAGTQKRARRRRARSRV